MQVLEDKVNKPEQRINSKLEGQLKLHYCNKIKNSTDPYKKAVKYHRNTIIQKKN